jgi:hypothetical protein
MGGRDGCWLRGGSSTRLGVSDAGTLASGACPTRAARFRSVARLFWNQELTTLVSLGKRVSREVRREETARVSHAKTLAELDALLEGRVVGSFKDIVKGFGLVRQVAVAATAPAVFECGVLGRRGTVHLWGRDYREL